jgi:hypothetical protein
VLLWITAVYAAARMLALFRFSVDAPFGDQWNFATLLRTTQNGFTWSDLWAAHNEHRIVVPNALMLTLAKATHWNIRVEIALIHALIGLRFAIVLFAAYRIGRKAKLATWTCVPVIAAFMLTRAQAENLMWGWQITLTVGALFTLLCCLTLANGGWPRFVLSVLLAVAAQLSFASGVVLWPVGLLFIATHTKLSARTRIVRCVLWALIGSVLTFFYNRGLPRATETLPVSASRMLKYVVIFLGSAVTPMRATPAVDLAWNAGLVGLGLLVLGVVGVLATRQFARWSPIIMWGVTAPAIALVTAYGRLGFVEESQALSSRYVTLSVSLWAAAAVLLTATALHLLRNRSRRVIGAIGAVAISIASVGVVTVAGPWESWSKSRRDDSLRNRAILAEDAQMTPANIALLLADPKIIETERPFLIAQRFTQFRSHVPASTIVPTTIVPTTIVPPTTVVPTTIVPPTTTPAPTTIAPSTTAAPTPATVALQGQ